MRIRKKFSILSAILTALLVISPFRVSSVIEGDFVLEGNDVFEVKDKEFEVAGDVILKDDATLIVEHGTLYIVQDRPVQYSYTLLNQAEMILRRGAELEIGPWVTSHPIYLRDESVLNVTDSSVHIGIAGGDNSSVWVKNSDLDSLGAYANTSVQIEDTTIRLGIGTGDLASVKVANSTMSYLRVTGSAQVWMEDSTVQSLSADEKSSVWVLNSTLEGIALSGSSCVWLVNSHLTDIEFEGTEAALIHGWYLTVNVKSDNQVVEDADVEVFYRHNGSVAARGTTDSDGNVRFVLPEWIVQQLGGRYVGDYSIKVSHNNMYGEENVTLSFSKQVSVDLVKSTPPPFYTTPLGIGILVIVAFLVGVVIATFFFRRKRSFFQ